MIAGDALLDVFINANVLFCIGYLIWLALRSAMTAVGLGHAYGTQLRLLNAVFVAVICAPVFVLAFGAIQYLGLARGVSLNLSDAVVAIYLNGGIDMKAAEFEHLVMMRDTMLLDVMSGQTLLAQALIAAFLFGLALGLFQLAVSIFCLWRIVHDSYAWRSFGRLRIRLSDNTLVPFSTRGLRNYYVVLPSTMLASQADVKVSLAHEFEHIRQGDLEWEVVIEALKPLFFLNPAYHAWKRQVENLRELNCDTAVLSSGRIDKRSYCETLLSVCQNTLRRERAFVIAVPKVTLVTADRSLRFRGGAGLLEHRIRSLLDARRLAHEKLIFAALAVPLLAAIALTTLAIQSPGDWSHDRLMLSTVVNNERMVEINRLTTFGRVRN